MALSADSVTQWRGADVIDEGGGKVGTVEEIYLDRQTDEPAWALIKTGLFGSRATFVPLSGASPDGDRLRVPFEKSRIKGAPKVDPERELSEHEEHELHSHYGLDGGESRPGTVSPEGGAGS